MEVFAEENDAVEQGTREVPAETSLMQITKGEVDMQVSTAKRFPRVVSKVVDDAITMATLDTATAVSCFFALPIGGELVEGPSIRLAEIMAATWGNLRCEARGTEEGREFVTAQATTWDMEKNTLIRIEAKRRIVDKYGNRYKRDLIIKTQNAATSIALRNSLFRVIPRALVMRVYASARKVALGDAMTMGQRRKSAFSTFKLLGVDEDRILAKLGRRSADDINAEDLSKLLGLLNAIKDDAISVEEAFPEIKEENNNGKPKGSKTDEVLEQLQAKEQNTPESENQPPQSTQAPPDDEPPPPEPPEASEEERVEPLPPDDVKAGEPAGEGDIKKLVQMAKSIGACRNQRGFWPFARLILHDDQIGPGKDHYPMTETQVRAIRLDLAGRGAKDLFKVDGES